MKKNFYHIIAICILMTLGSASNLCKAQSDKPIQGKEFVENQPFKGFFDNKEFDIFMQVDLYSNGITVPDHELYGELPGYLAKQHNNFCWLITKAKVKSNKVAEISLINDFGSEDLTATFTQVNDSTFILQQGDGSALKVPNRGKWQKLPSSIEFVKPQTATSKH